MSTISKWFDKKRGMALGITSSGASLGTVVMAPFATFLVANFGWRSAYIVLGAIAWLVVLPLSSLFKRNPHEIGALPDGEKSDSTDGRFEKPKNNQEDSLQSAGLSLRQLFSTGIFWLFIFIFLFTATSRFIILTHLVPHVTDIGFSAAQAAAVFSLLGVTAVVGRVFMGTISDKIGRKLTFIICSLVETGAMVWLIWARDLWMLYLFVVVGGFAFGGSTPAMIALVGDTFGLSNIGKILGVLELGFGVGAAIGPALGGLIFDIRNSYFIAFSLVAVVVFVRTLLITLIKQERILESGQGR
jgi:MFS family permease